MILQYEKIIIIVKTEQKIKMQHAINEISDNATGPSGFSLHNIEHSSASQINQWAECPHMWIAQYLFNRRSAFGAAAKSGVLVEEAIVNVLARGFTADMAIAHAMSEYNKFTALGATDSDNNRGAAMSGMILGALDVLKEYGTPDFDKDESGKLKQRKVDLLCRGDGFDIPVIGYLDFVFEKHGVVIDLKSTMRLPSEMSPPHLRQACIYRKAVGNMGVKFLYCTGSKTKVIDCPDPSDTLSEIKSILNRQNKFLLSGDKEHLRSIVPLITSSYYSDAGITMELFGV